MTTILTDVFPGTAAVRQANLAPGGRHSLRHLLLAFGVAALIGSPAAAIPISTTLTIVPAQSPLTLTISVLGGPHSALSASVATSLSGTQDITLDDRDPPFTSFSLDGGAGSFGMPTVSLFMGGLGNLTLGFAHSQSQGLSSLGSIPATYEGGMWNYTFDPGDNAGGSATNLPLVGSVVTYNGTGAVGALLGSGTLDFTGPAASPELPSLGQLGVIQQAPLVGPFGAPCYASLMMTAPISLSMRIDSNAFPEWNNDLYVDITLTGQMVASGDIFFCPEPATIVLIGLGSLIVLPVVRRAKGKARG